MGMTVEDVQAYVKRKLGLGIQSVELTDLHMQDVIDDTNRWFAFRLGQKQFLKIDIVKGKNEYVLPGHVIEVLSVRFPSNSLGTNALGTDDFSYAYGYLFGSWFTNSVGNGAQGSNSYYSSPYPYSDLVMRLQYLETIGRIWSADIEHVYDPANRTLLVTPGPIIAGVILIEYWSSIIDPRQFDPQDEDFYLRWALAEAKDTLGRVRTKYDSYPTVGGDRLLNGDTLLQEAREEKEKLEQEVIQRRRSIPIVTG